ncbi:MAG TPA: CRISPR-associated RAMP protein Csx7 [Ktedonobacteraceae bacterium]|nr:CRISPR-associated RAMP protein Csx7 [Ktedonobacteraceae bacterium]
MTTLEQMDRYTLRNRYVFQGRLVMKTPLHIGGGRATLSQSNSPVVLTPEGLPFIPGASFKGALRSTVEKLVPSLSTQLFSCGLIELDREELDEIEKKLKAKEQPDKRVCSTQLQRYFANKRRDNPGQRDAIVREELEMLCNTCQLFGSPFAASHININDLYMPKDEQSDVIERRDGVAIDRDSEKAKDRLKYDFEIVPSTTAFQLEITLENASEEDLQLVCVGLSEFVHGFGGIGGLRSRGLGACKLENLNVSALELTGINETQRKERLRNFLLRREFSSTFTDKDEQGLAFLNSQIEKIFR